MSNEVPLKNPAREEFMHQKKNNHASRGQTYGDADSNGRSDATRQVFVWSHQSSYGYQKQQNLSHRRDSQKIEIWTRRIWQADYLDIWNQQIERNHVTINHLNAEVER